MALRWILWICVFVWLLLSLSDLYRIANPDALLRAPDLLNWHGKYVAIEGELVIEPECAFIRLENGILIELESGHGRRYPGAYSHFEGIFQGGFVRVAGILDSERGLGWYGTLGVSASARLDGCSLYWDAPRSFMLASMVIGSFGYWTLVAWKRMKSKTMMTNNVVQVP